MSDRTVSWYVLLILVLFMSLGPFSLQIFLPALPSSLREFGVETGILQLTLSLATAAMAVATILYGPYSDRYGRRPLVLVSLVLFIAGSIWSSLAPDVWHLIAGRIVQATGGASGMVLAMAMARDLYDREQATRVIAYLTASMVIGSMIAPVIGGVLTDLIGWRWVFVAMAIASLVVLGAVFFFLEETHHSTSSDPGFRTMPRDIWILICNPLFVGYTFFVAFQLAGFYAFLSVAPYITSDILGRSATEFGFYIIVISSLFASGNFLSARMIGRFDPNDIILAGSTFAFLSIIVMVWFVVAGIWNPYTVFLPYAIGGLGAGMAMPAAQTAVLSINPALAGTAAGFTRFVQMMLAAVFMQITGMFQDETPYALTVALALISVSALLSIIVTKQISEGGVLPVS
jgi:DHA1 family bicyclomycin/chloramphenicol resistance-like MFS transporter